jgi:mono/diheme cytochrome c family protein
VYDPPVVADARSIRAVGHGGTRLKIKVLTASAIALAVLLLGPWASRADVAAGKARFNALCGQCHDSADFENENPQALAATLRRIVSGELRHKKPLQLSDQEIQDIAAYMSTGGK